MARWLLLIICHCTWVLLDAVHRHSCLLALCSSLCSWHLSLVCLTSLICANRNNFYHWKSMWVVNDKLIINELGPNAGGQVLPLYIVSKRFSWGTSTGGSVLLICHRTWFFGVLCNRQNVCWLLHLLFVCFMSLVCKTMVISFIRSSWVAMLHKICMWMDDEKLKNINKLGPINISLHAGIEIWYIPGIPGIYYSMSAIIWQLSCISNQSTLVCIPWLHDASIMRSLSVFIYHLPRCNKHLCWTATTKRWSHIWSFRSKWWT